MCTIMIDNFPFEWLRFGAAAGKRETPLTNTQFIRNEFYRNDKHKNRTQTHTHTVRDAKDFIHSDLLVICWAIRLVLMPDNIHLT